MNQIDYGALVRGYYAAIDEMNLDHIFSLFSENIEYERGSRTFRGLNEFQQFYKHERTIAEGVHTIQRLEQSKPGTIIVEGEFSGTLKDGEAVTLSFQDIFECVGDKIVKRHTIFPGREV